MPNFIFSKLRANRSAFVSRGYTRLSIAFVAALAFTGGVAASSQVTYTITDLGTSSTGHRNLPTSGFALNISGDVAGSAVTNSGQVHAVIFRAGKVVDLGVLPAAQASVGSGINGYGEVTGYAQFPAPGTPDGSFTHAFLYKAGTMKDIGALPGDTASAGAAINDSGQIAGSSTTQKVVGGPLFPAQHGFLYTRGAMVNVAAPAAGALQTNALGINAAGQVAGSAILSGGVQPQAAVFTRGIVNLLDLRISPSEPSHAYSLNDSDQVTGWLYHADQDTEAFLVTNNKRVPITGLKGPYTFGNSINAAGAFVGNSYSVSGPNHSFLYTRDGVIHDLNALLPAASGWTLTNAEAINDKGQITGTGTSPAGVSRAYLLSPVFVPFSKLKAEIDLSDAKHQAFAAKGTFVLRKKTSSIDPMKETLVLQIGGYHLAIPPSSFIKTHGAYFFRGRLGEVEVDAILWRASPGVFLFQMSGKGAAGLPVTCPESVSLTIGNDSGTERMNDDHGGLRDCHME